MNLKLKATISMIVLFLGVLFLGLTVRGTIGDPIYYQKEKSTQVGGPFEASNSSARYALTEAIVENGSLTLNYAQAEFSAPDVVDYKGKFMSIFTPGVSFIGVPLYVLGLSFGYPQLFAYFAVSLFAVLNIFLIARLSQKLGTTYSAGLLAGFLFTFATNGLSYAQSYTQHHMSTAFILLAIMNAMDKRTWKSNFLFGSYLGIGILLDIPNAFMMMPIAFFVVSKHFIAKKVKGKRLAITFKLSIVSIAFGLLPFAGAFAYYNQVTTGSLTTLAQNIGRSKVFSGLPPQRSNDGPEGQIKAPTSKRLPFSSRKQLEGFYILFVSNERAWIYYSPIVLIGLVGLILLYKNDKTRGITSLILGVILTDALIYAMFGDPWGGWAFGPRYLIPSAALMLAAGACVIDRFKSKPLFFILFSWVAAYSIWINVLGVTTTSVVPPKVEAINLPDPIPYTWEYNQQLLSVNRMSSLVYNISLSHAVPGERYVAVISALIFATVLGLYGVTLLERQKQTK